MTLWDAIHANLFTPAVLFFVLGTVAALSKSDLKFPESLYTTLTIYLLVSIGFKGGVAISEASFASVWLPLIASSVISASIPTWSYAILRFRGRFAVPDAAAIAAHYGSVSAVTFITATNFLQRVHEPYEPYAASFLAVMESPAIIVGLLLAKRATIGGGAVWGDPTRRVLHEALFGRSVLLLVGSLIIGTLSGKRGLAMTEGFFVTPFQGILALFLLEMGMVAARRIVDLKKVGWFLLAFGILAPLFHGLLGVSLAKWVGLSTGGMTLFGVLAASASYIAAPAAMRVSVPEANPTFYLTASLVITFPFNIAIGIPTYFAFARWLNL